MGDAKMTLDEFLELVVEDIKKLRERKSKEWMRQKKVVLSVVGLLQRELFQDYDDHELVSYNDQKWTRQYTASKGGKVNVEIMSFDKSKNYTVFLWSEARGPEMMETEDT